MVPDLPAEHLGVVTDGSPLGLLLADAGAEQPADPHDLHTVAALVTRTVVDGHLQPLADAVHAETRIATGLLWGNAASALVGAVRVLSRGAVLEPGPGDAAAAAPGGDAADMAAADVTAGAAASARRLGGLAAALLATDPLAGAGRYTLNADGTLDPASFVRRSCCLYYRIPPGGICGDCSLTDERM
jgi:iron complex transport system ATP-binding protein